MHLMHKAGLALALLTAAGLAVDRPASAQTLTGSSLFSTDSSGNHSGINVWTTGPGGPNLSRLWTYQGATLASASATDATLNLALTPGTYNFNIYGSNGVANDFHGLNLFFDGQAITPGISVKANTLVSSSGTSAFTANGGNTLTQNAQGPISGANTLTFVDGATTIQLTAFSWADPSVYNIDRVSTFTATPDGFPDYVGSYTLKVTNASPVPESSSYVSLGLLLLLGLGGVVISRRRKAGTAH